MSREQKSAQQKTTIKARALLPTDDFIAVPPNEILENLLRRLTKPQLITLRKVSKHLYQFATLALFKFHYQNPGVAGYAFELMQRWAYVPPNNLVMPLPPEPYIRRAAKSAVATKGPAALLYGEYVAAHINGQTRKTNAVLADFLFRALRAFEQPQPPAELTAAQVTLKDALPSLLANLWPELGLDAATTKRGYVLAEQAGISKEDIAGAKLRKPTETSALPIAKKENPSPEAPPKTEIDRLLDAIREIQETDTEIAASTRDTLLAAATALGSRPEIQDMRVLNALRRKLMVSTDPKLAQNTIPLLGNIAEKARLLKQPIADLIFDLANRKNKVGTLNPLVFKAAVKALKFMSRTMYIRKIPIKWGFAFMEESSEKNEHYYPSASRCIYENLSCYVRLCDSEAGDHTGDFLKRLLAGVLTEALTCVGETPDDFQTDYASLNHFTALQCLAKMLDPTAVEALLSETLKKASHGTITDPLMDLLAALSDQFNSEQVSRAVEQLRTEFIGNTTRNGDLPNVLKRLGTMAKRCQHDQKVIASLIFDLVNQEQAPDLAAAVAAIKIFYSLKQAGVEDIPQIPLVWAKVIHENQEARPNLEAFCYLRQGITEAEADQITEGSLPSAQTETRTLFAKYLDHIPEPWINTLPEQVHSMTATIYFDALTAYSTKMQDVPDRWVERTLFFLQQPPEDRERITRDFLVFIAPKLNADQAQEVLDVILPRLPDQDAAPGAIRIYGDLYLALLSVFQRRLPADRVPHHPDILKTVLDHADLENDKNFNLAVSALVVSTSKTPWEVIKQFYASFLPAPGIEKVTLAEEERSPDITPAVNLTEGAAGTSDANPALFSETLPPPPKANNAPETLATDRQDLPRRQER